MALERDPDSSRIADLAEGMLNILPQPVLLIDAEDRIVWMNSAGENFFHMSARLAEGTGLAQVIPFGSPLMSLLPRVRADGATVTEYKVDLGTPRIGGNRVVDVFASPSGEAADGVMLLLQPRGMAERIDSQLVSRGSARSVVGLAAMLAHEIKNPLSGIRGAAQLLEQSVSSEDRALTYLIRDETDRIVKLVERMEVFGDERPMPRTEINIHEVLARVKALANAGFAAGVRIVEDYDPSLPLLQGNEDRLIQVFLNLVKNASEALSDRTNGEIFLQTAFKPGIRLKVPGSSETINMPIEVAVRDNGPGIPSDIRPHLFDAFVTTKETGSGLGLALVAKYVADHGGIVDLDGGEGAGRGGGTTVRVLLPWSPRPPHGPGRGLGSRHSRKVSA